MKRHPQTLYRGFTLIEIAIVMIIMAAFSVGVMSAYSLIEKAQANNIMNEYKSIRRATSMFYGTSYQLPGDSNLDRINSAQNGAPTDISLAKGNNDGKIIAGYEAIDASASAVNLFDEAQDVFKDPHLNTIESYNFFVELTKSQFLKTNIIANEIIPSGTNDYSTISNAECGKGGQQLLASNAFDDAVILPLFNSTEDENFLYFVKPNPSSAVVDRGFSGKECNDLLKYLSISDSVVEYIDQQIDGQINGSAGFFYYEEFGADYLISFKLDIL